MRQQPSVDGFPYLCGLETDKICSHRLTDRGGLASCGYDRPESLGPERVRTGNPGSVIIP